MNKERILEVADLIDHSDTFTMTCEANRINVSGHYHCGTPACVIGHANVIRLSEEGKKAPFNYNDLGDTEAAANYLELDEDQAEAMFYPRYWSRDGAYLASDVSAGLRAFAESGKINDLNYKVQPERPQDDVDLD